MVGTSCKVSDWPGATDSEIVSRFTVVVCCLPSRSTTTGVTWFPTAWPDPIVRRTDPAITVNGTPGGSWPQNPGPFTFPAVSGNDLTCATGNCHVQGGAGGRLPGLSTNLDGFCYVVLDGVRNRNIGDVDMTGAMPPIPFNAPQSYDKVWQAIDDACATTPASSMTMPPSKQTAPSGAMMMAATFPMSSS